MTKEMTFTKEDDIKFKNQLAYLKQLGESLTVHLAETADALNKTIDDSTKTRNLNQLESDLLESQYLNINMRFNLVTAELNFLCKLVPLLYNFNIQPIYNEIA